MLHLPVMTFDFFFFFLGFLLSDLRSLSRDLLVTVRHTYYGASTVLLAPLVLFFMRSGNRDCPSCMLLILTCLEIIVCR